MRQIVDLQANYQQFLAAKAQILAVAVQDTANAGRMAQVSGAAFPILADADHAVADAYGVYNLLGDGVAAPSVFIINEAGQIVWSYIGQNAIDRPTVDVILENLP